MNKKIYNWNMDNTYRGSSLFVDELKAKGLSDVHIEGVLDTLDDICKECWDAPAGCQCWNDE